MSNSPQVAFEAGFAVREITPDAKRQTLYHALGMVPDDRVPIRDPLFVRAAAFRGGGRLAVWATLDILTIARPLLDGAAARLAREGIRPEHFTLCATHTHTASSGVHFNGIEPVPEEYAAFLEAEAARAAADAVRALRPAEVAFGKSTLDLGVNRRQIGRMREVNDLRAPTGLVDNEVHVARVRRLDDGAGALLFHYTAHPLTMDVPGPAISADFPGRAVGFLLDKGFAHAQFLQGCAGNVNVKITGDAPEAALAGQLLAEAALRAAEAAVPSRSHDLRSATRTVRLPWDRVPSLAEARETLRNVEAGQARRKDACELEWAQGVVRAIETGQARPYAEVLVQALKLGDAVFVALPGEEFVEIGLQIKQRAGLEHLFVVAYANNCEIGYVPTKAAFAEGGYEVENAPSYYGLFRLSPDCERIIVESAVSAVAAVAAQ